MSLYDDNTTNYEDKNPKKEAKDDLIDIHSLNSARDYRFNKQIEIYDTFLKTLDNENYKKLGLYALEFYENFKWKKIIKKYIELI